jgi:Ca2+-binding RTX toxin-like protein
LHDLFFTFVAPGATIEDMFSFSWGGGLSTTVGGTGITLDADGAPESGTVTALFNSSISGASSPNTFSMYGFSVSVAAFAAAVQTASTADDLALMRAALSGDDLLAFSGTGTHPAWGFGGNGNDTLIGSNGNDLYDGGSGTDTAIMGMNGNIFRSGLGNDELYGLNGNDRLFGEGGNDKLFGNQGRDMLVGGSGAD